MIPFQLRKTFSGCTIENEVNQEAETCKGSDAVVCASDDCGLEER